MRKRNDHFQLFIAIFVVVFCTFPCFAQVAYDREVLPRVDLNGDGRSTYGDQTVLATWILEGGDLTALFANLVTSSNGIYDLSEFFSSDRAQIQTSVKNVNGGGTSGLDQNPCWILRGDANNDGKVDTADPIYMFSALYMGGLQPRNLDEADANDDGFFDVSDPILVFDHLDSGVLQIAPPFPKFGYDLTFDTLVQGCEVASPQEVVTVMDPCDDSSSPTAEGYCYLRQPEQKDCQSDPDCGFGIDPPDSNIFIPGELYETDDIERHYVLPEWVTELALYRNETPWQNRGPAFVVPPGENWTGAGSSGAGSSSPTGSPLLPPPNLPEGVGGWEGALGFSCEPCDSQSGSSGSGGGLSDFQGVKPSSQPLTTPLANNPQHQTPGAAAAILAGRAAKWGSAAEQDNKTGFWDPCNVVGHGRYGRMLDANGVDWATGEYTMTREYLKLPGRGMDYVFSMTYRSTPRFLGGASAMGVGWDHYYFQRLQPWFTCDGSIGGLIRVVEGQVEYYVQVADEPDLYLEASEGFNRIRVVRDSSNDPLAYLLRTAEGTLFSFSPFKDSYVDLYDRSRSGQLDFVRDRHGNQLTCLYALSNQGRAELSEVVDTLGRSIQYDYNGDGMLSRVSVSSNGALREVVLTYKTPQRGASWPDSDYDDYGSQSQQPVAVLLAQVTGPQISTVPDQFGTETFTGSRRLKFDYRAYYRLSGVNPLSNGFTNGSNGWGDISSNRYFNNPVQMAVPMLTTMWAEDAISNQEERPFLRIKYDCESARVTEVLYGDIREYQARESEQCAQDQNPAGSQEVRKELAQKARGGEWTYLSVDYPFHGLCEQPDNGLGGNAILVGPEMTKMSVTRISPGGKAKTVHLDTSHNVQKVIEYDGLTFGTPGDVTSWVAGSDRAEEWSSALLINGEVACRTPCTYITMFKRNEKNQITETYLPNGNCEVSVYDPILGSLVRKRLHGSYTIFKATDAPSHWGGSQSYIDFVPSDDFVTIVENRFEPLYGNVTISYDPRNPDVLDDSGTWGPGAVGYFDLGNNSSENLRYEYLVDYQINASSLPPELEKLRIDFGLPDPFDLSSMDGVYLLDSLPSEVLAEPFALSGLLPPSQFAYSSGDDGNVVATRSPTATVPDGTTTLGSHWHTFEFGSGGQLLAESNAEGIRTTYSYHSSAVHGGSIANLSAIQSNSVAIYGQVGPLIVQSGGGFLHLLTEAESQNNFSTDRIYGESATTTYEYDAWGNICTTIDPIGRITEDRYNAENQLVQSTNALQYDAYYFYDELGNLVREEYEHGARSFTGQEDPTVEVAIPGAALGSPHSTVTPLTFVTAYKYDYAGNLVAKSQTYRDAQGIDEDNARTWLTYFDLDNNIIREIDAEGNVTDFAYTSRGLLWLTIDGNNPVGSVAPEYLGGAGYPNGPYPGEALYEPDASLVSGSPLLLPVAADARIHWKVYDGNTNVACEVDSWDQSKDPGSPMARNGNVTVYTYDVYDRLIETGSVRNGLDDLYRRVKTWYSPDHQIVKKEHYGDALLDATAANIMGATLASDVLLSRTRHVHDELGRQIRTEQDLFALADSGQGEVVSDVAVSLNFLDRLGLVTRTVDPEGYSGVSVYDYRDQLRSVQFLKASGNNSWETTTYWYDLANRKVDSLVEEFDQGQSTIPTQFYTTYIYDDLDRLIQKVDRVGHTERMRHDSRGNLIEAQDARGATILETFQRSGITQDLLINQNGNLRKYVADAFSRIAEAHCEMTDTGEGDANPVARVHSMPGAADLTVHQSTISTHFYHDRNDNVTARVDDRGNMTEYTYDALDQLTTIVRPYDPVAMVSPTVTIQYDLDGLVTSKTDENGTVVSHSYDGAHREVLRSVSALSSSSVQWDGQVQWFLFDGNDRVVWSSDSNDPALAVSDDHFCTKLYDSLGRIVEERFNDRDSVLSSFDLNGNKTRLIYPGGESLEVEFDSRNRPSMVGRVGNPVEPLLTYQYRGGQSRVLGRTCFGEAGTGVELTVQYDELGRLLDLRHEATAGVIDDQFEYGYNRNNLKTLEVRTQAGTQDRWDFDSINRLQREVRNEDSITFGTGPGYTKEYWVDGVGNWLATKEDPLTGSSTIASEYRNSVDERNHYTTFNGQRMERDFVGNRTVGLDQRTYQYDGFDRLIAVFENGVELATYEYYADHRRARKSGVNSENYLFDGNRLLEIWDDGQAGLKRWFIYGLGQLRVTRYGRYEGGQPVEYLLGEDGTGSTTVLYDTSGQVVERYDYNAHGEVTFQDASRAAYAEQESQYDSHFLYAGYLYEPEVAHYWLKFRIYDPETGRFLTTDPIGVWGDSNNFGNGYGYCGFNPINGKDYLGLDESYFEQIKDFVGDTVDKGFDAVKDFGDGVVEGVGNGIDSIGDMLSSDPLELTEAAVEGIREFCSDPEGHIREGLEKGWYFVRNADIKEWGEATGELAVGLLGGGGVAGGVKALVRKGGGPKGRRGGTGAGLGHNVAKKAPEGKGPRTPAPKGGNHGHHSDPKFLGGEPKQKLTDMPAPDHRQLHKDLNDHLKTKTDEFGNHMRPQRGNSGAKIRENFTREQRLDATAEFYRKNAEKYPDAAKDFFDQHPKLSGDGS